MASSSEPSQGNLNAWNLWFFDKTLGEDSGEYVISFYNAERLKQALRNAATEDPLFPYECTYNFFKKGFKPDWKNPKKNAGGRYVLVYDALTSSEAINHLWNKLLINLMEKESWRGIRNFINGATVEKLQNNFHKLCIWITKEGISDKMTNNLMVFFEDLFAFLPGLYKIINEKWSTEEIKKLDAIPMPTTRLNQPRPKWIEETEDEILLKSASSGKHMKCWEFRFAKPKLRLDNLFDWEGNICEGHNFEQLQHLFNEYELIKTGGPHKFSEYRLKKKGMDLNKNILEYDKTRATVRFYLPIFEIWEEAKTQWEILRKAILRSALLDNIEYEFGGGIRRFNQDGVNYYQISLWTRFDEEKTDVTSHILAQEMARGRTNTFAALFLEMHRSRKGATAQSITSSKDKSSK